MTVTMKNHSEFSIIISRFPVNNDYKNMDLKNKNEPF